MKDISRRKVLKEIGLISLGMTMLNKGALSGNKGESFSIKDINRTNNSDIDFDRPVTAIVLGAGERGNVYAGYAVKNPNELNIVGVAEPIPYRINKFSKQHQIPKEKQFVTWEHVFEQEKFADAVIISTPDKLHYGAAMKALEMGYDLLLEKPIAQSWKECNDILQQQKKFNNIVAVCHVLRYAPYFLKMKEVIDSGKIGEVINVQHLEPVSFDHIAHSYVRGPWKNEKESTPMLLAKSCHDIDIIKWILNKKCERVSSFGSLKWFKPQNAPKGCTKRCTDGCAVEAACPYSAIKIYARDKGWHLRYLDVKERSFEHIVEKLKTSPYGLCVYHAGNDVVDHQVVNMQFEEDITVGFTMAFAGYAGRRTRVMGSMGDIVGDMTNLHVFNYNTKKRETWNTDDIDIDDGAFADHGHGGGDIRLARDFVRAVKLQDPKQLTSTIDASMESHLIGYMAEKSRKEGGKMYTINMKA
ncbi:Gfo/Idh/MocA family protein [Mariniphaga sediminis]|uniref:Gfo/Idh/MocA family protein n=1 Tax=Mariniphaga sediminis TaxID=1628158 RepID=UPI003569C26E